MNAEAAFKLLLLDEVEGLDTTELAAELDSLGIVFERAPEGSRAAAGAHVVMGPARRARGPCRAGGAGRGGGRPRRERP